MNKGKAFEIAPDRAVANPQPGVEEFEIVKAPAYDFEFIAQALGLIPVKEGKEAINPAAITSVYRDDEDPTQWIIAFYGDETCVLSDSDMPELENQLRIRAEIARQMFQGGERGGLIEVPTGKRLR